MRIFHIVSAFAAAITTASALAIPQDIINIAARDNPTSLAILEKLQAFTSDFSYPKFLSIAKNVTYSGFDANVVCRIDVTQEYVGNELCTEYVFGLAASCAQANTTIILPYVLNQTVIGLSIDGPVAAVTLLSYFDFKRAIGVVPVEVEVWFRFTDKLQIISLYGSFRRFPWLMDTFTPALGQSIAAELKIRGPAAKHSKQLILRRAALDVCGAHQTYCHGRDQQYKSYQDCMHTLLNKPLGEWYAMGVDNVMCRWIHQGMVQYRPAVHCPHLGPTGGNMCQQRTYQQMTLQNPFQVGFLPPPPP